MIRFEKVSLSYKRNGRKSTVVENLTVEFNRRDFTCILGPSGCGKSTLLNAIAGFKSLDGGSISIDGISHKSTVRVGYVFQDHNIFPWKTVRQNIAFGLTISTASNDTKRKKVELIADEVGLLDSLDLYPRSLSGGMRQRVGIARALVSQPDIILMDEPFSSLDALTATKSRRFLKRIAALHGTTIVFVTHNIEEAVMLSDRIIVLSSKPAHVLLNIHVNAKTSSEANLKKISDRIYQSLEESI